MNVYQYSLNITSAFQMHFEKCIFVFDSYNFFFNLSVLFISKIVSHCNFIFLL